jgi:uncharacterized protein (DUF342 family)
MHEAQLVDQRFAIIAVNRKVISRQAYNNALKQQKRLYAQTKEYTLIGDILLNQGDIKEDQRDEFFSFSLAQPAPSNTHTQDPKQHQEAQDYIVQPTTLFSESKFTGSNAVLQKNNDKTALTDDGFIDTVNEDIQSAQTDDEVMNTVQENIQTVQTNDVMDTVQKDLEADRPDKDVKKEIGLNITVSDDNMRAFISFHGEDVSEIDLEDIKLFLERKGVKKGIVDDDLITQYLKQNQISTEPCLIAEGVPPDPGEPDKITYFFDTNPMRISTVDEDGNIDWKDRGQIPQVEAGDLLAEIKPGREGDFGVDIFGRNILPESSLVIKLKHGKEVKTSEDGLQFYSLVKGMPQRSEDDTLEVSQVYIIEGDVDIKTGHIDFDGHIEVSGVIEKGFIVKGKSLKTKGILGAEVTISGDIFVSEGIFSSKIICDGRIKAGHIHTSNIVVLGDIEVETEITESTIEASGKCVVEGTILSSEICARKGIKSKNIGSEAASPSMLTVGIDFVTKRKVDEINKLILQKEKESKEQDMLIKTLREKAEQLSTKLGETAQTQDRLMVEKRKLTQTQKGEVKELSESDKKRLQQFESAIVKVDEQVAVIMEQEDKVADDISNNQIKIDSVKQEIVELNKHVEEVIDSSKTDKGVPVVKNSGFVFAGTKIKGPHASIDIQENLCGISIKEKTKKIDENKQIWEMSISQF